MRHIGDAERRARLASRHSIAPWSRVSTPEAATRAMTVLHATEPATVHLSCWARVDDVTVAGVERALHTERSLVKQLAMRRTLFVFPRDLLPAAWGSAARRTAGTERARMVKDVVEAGLSSDGAAWLDEARRRVLDVLSEVPEGLQATEIRKAVPFIDVRLAGSVWSASRVLTHLGATGDLVRAVNTGHWRTSRPRWALMTHWLDPVEEHLDPAAGYREIVRRWLTTFGPGTEADIVWWLGATKGIVRAALADLEAVEVSLDSPSGRAGTGWVLPDDVDEAPPTEPWVGLLPVLDATVMGWKERTFYLGPHAPELFDRNGNAGTTAWVDGRIVGCWVQDDAGVVGVRLLEVVPRAARAALDAEAARLTDWLDGLRVGTVYPSPTMRLG